jgi:hypothetical protein
MVHEVNGTPRIVRVRFIKEPLRKAKRGVGYARDQVITLGSCRNLIFCAFSEKTPGEVRLKFL